MVGNGPIGHRVELLWNRGEADVWYRGVMLEVGRVEIENSALLVSQGSFVLQAEEIADLRLHPQE